MLMDIENLTGELMFRCKECQDHLVVTEDKDTIWVEPCHNCMADQYDEGYQDGEDNAKIQNPNGRD